MIIGERIGLWTGNEQPVQVKNYPKFTNTSENNTIFALNRFIESGAEPTIYLDYSFSPNGPWENLEKQTSIQLTPGQSIYVKCRHGYTNTTTGSVVGNGIACNCFTAPFCRVGGNFQYLLGENLDDVTELTGQGILGLFRSSGISEVDDTFELPTAKPTSYCYDQLFALNTNLTNVPDDLFINFKDSNLLNYDNLFMMSFYGCTNLVDMPDMNFRYLGTKAFYRAFYNCNKLSECKPLKFCIAKEYCFAEMFANAFDQNADVSVPDNFITSYSETEELYMPQFCFNATFSGSKITYVGSNLASNFVVDGLYTDNVFDSCFRNCTYLTTVSDDIFEGFMDVPITGSYMFNYMFNGCTSLTNLPVLPNLTDVPIGCFQYMFGNTALTSIPSGKMPQATTARSSSYQGMFTSCSRLVTVDNNALPATTAYGGAYNNTFSNCTSLTNIPVIAATTIMGDGVCRFMFGSCTSLQSFEWSEKILVKTTGVENFRIMFSGCTSITDFGTIEVNKVDARTFYGTFNGCSNLTSGKFINNDTNEYSETCYQMFYNCNKYVLDVVLHTTTYGTVSMYKEMCSHTQNSSTLNHITVYWDNWNNSNNRYSNTYQWLSWGPSNGTISVPYGTPESRGDNAERSGWTIYYRVNED